MVALKNNKGISLVDVLIAIAVMALLLSPIILHTATTINTSAEAKEKQYVVDSATAVMEYFNQSTIEDLESGKGSSGLVSVTVSDDPIDPNPAYHKITYDSTNAKIDDRITCSVTVNGTPVTTVKYTATDFTLDPISLGRDKEQYSRGVVMSDLANRLMAGKAENGKRYRINYQVPDTLDGVSINSVGKIEVLSDHSAVVFDDTNSIVRHIKAIECVEITDSNFIYNDPNDVSIGNIQDLDANKIAIIEGDQTKLDHRFESDLISKILDYASRHAGIIDEDILADTNNLNSTLSGIIRSEANDFDRMIYISVLRQTNGNKKYYNVKCTLSYYIKFANSDFKIFNSNTSNSGCITYDIMNRDFYTSEPPDVYMVYEPFITNSSPSATSTNYGYHAYFCIKADQYTSGGDGKTDPSKIYLIKPEVSFQSTLKDKGYNVYPASLSTVGLAQAENMYFTKTPTGYQPVDININQVLPDVNPDPKDVTTDENGITTDNFDQSKCLPLQVVTNMTSYTYAGVHYPRSLHTVSLDTSDNNSMGGILESRQFSLENNCPINDFDDVISAYGTRKEYSETISSLKDADGNFANSIVTPYNDANYNGKLYNIAVTYINSNGEKTYLTGAKGAE